MARRVREPVEQGHDHDLQWAWKGRVCPCGRQRGMPGDWTFLDENGQPSSASCAFCGAPVADAMDARRPGV